ncbi:hypothetical protein D3C73_896290 [compost metagenome]
MLSLKLILRTPDEYSSAVRKFFLGFILLLANNKEALVAIKIVSGLVLKFEPVSFLLAGSGCFSERGLCVVSIWNAQLYASRFIAFESFISLLCGPVNIAILLSVL